MPRASNVPGRRTHCLGCPAPSATARADRADSPAETHAEPPPRILPHREPAENRPIQRRMGSHDTETSDSAEGAGGARFENHTDVHSWPGRKPAGQPLRTSGSSQNPLGTTARAENHGNSRRLLRESSTSMSEGQTSVDAGCPTADGLGRARGRHRQGRSPFTSPQKSVRTRWPDRLFLGQSALASRSLTMTPTTGLEPAKCFSRRLTAHSEPLVFGHTMEGDRHWFLTLSGGGATWSAEGSRGSFSRWGRIIRTIVLVVPPIGRST